MSNEQKIFDALYEALRNNTTLAPNAVIKLRSLASILHMATKETAERVAAETCKSILKDLQESLNQTKVERSKD